MHTSLGIGTSIIPWPHHLWRMLKFSGVVLNTQPGTLRTPPSRWFPTQCLGRPNRPTVRYVNKKVRCQQPIKYLIEHPWPLTIIFLGPRQVQHHLIPCKMIIRFNLVSHDYALIPRHHLTRIVGLEYKSHQLMLPPLPNYTPVPLPFLFCPQIGDIYPK